MFNERPHMEKGHMKEIEIGSGTLMLVGTFNLMELELEERELVFALVDKINDFERAKAPHGNSPAATAGSRIGL